MYIKFVYIYSLIIIYSLLGKLNKNKQKYGRKNRYDQINQIDMVQKLTLGLHLITKRLGLCMPNKLSYMYYIFILT